MNTELFVNHLMVAGGAGNGIARPITHRALLNSAAAQRAEFSV
jgi:hypothetical protein